MAKEQIPNSTEYQEYNDVLKKHIEQLNDMILSQKELNSIINQVRQEQS